MVEFSNIPSDGDFSGWRSYLGDKVASCDSTFQGYSLKWGQQLFSTFEQPSKAAALENALDGGSIGSDYLFPKRGGEFAFVIIAIVMLVIGIVAALALTQCFRKWISRCLCGRCRNRDRVRMKEAPPHDRSFLCVSHGFACVSIIVLGVLCYITTAQNFEGFEAASCNMWGQLYGHFFGTSRLSAGDYGDIAFNWQGTYDMLEAVAHIGAQAQAPDGEDHSPIYNLMNARYQQMRANATAKATETSNLVQEFMNNATIFQETVKVINNNTLSLTADPAVLKGQLFQDELRETLQNGWVEIERILETYAGADAELTVQAVDSVNASTITIQQIDRVMAEMAKLWEGAFPLLATLVYLVGSIEIVAVSVGIIIACVVLWLTLKLLNALRHDVFPTTGERTTWAVSYGTCCVLAGVFALLCAVHVMTAAVGSDACLMAEDALFVRGNWNVLGSHILHPIDNMEVDVKAVLDTCVRADGNGDVASALGLDGRIRSLAEAVVKAQADVSATREALLQRDEKGTRAQVLQLGFHDVAQMVTVGRNGIYGFNPYGFLESFAYWNETRHVRADIDYDYPEIGPRSVLCLVPSMPETVGWILYTCLGEGLQYDVSPMNILADTVNNALIQIGNPVGVPSAFCSALLRDGGHSCANSVLDTDVGWISGAQPSASQVNDWADIVNGTQFVQGQQLGDYYYSAGNKLKYALTLWQILETMAQTDMLTLTDIAQPPHFCPNSGQTCNFTEYRKNADAIFTSRSQEIHPAVLELFGIVDAYVDETVNPTMESLVVQANAITDRGNCQFEGTALHYGVLPALCEGVFPSNAVACIFTGLLSLIFFLMAVHVWKWFHFLDDLAKAHGDSAENYNMSKEANRMSPDNLVLYSGVPTSAASPSSDAKRDVQHPDGRSTMQQDEVFHAAEPHTPFEYQGSPTSEYSPAGSATREPHTMTRTREESYTQLSSGDHGRGYMVQSEDSFVTFRS